MLMNYGKMPKFPGILDKDVKDWYDSQSLVQMMRPPPQKISKEEKTEGYLPIVAWFPFQRLYMDTMFIKRLGLVIVCGLDLYSRYGFARVYYGDREQGISSAKALSALLEFEGEMKNLGYKLNPYGAVYTDDVSEFKGDFKTYLKDKG